MFGVSDGREFQTERPAPRGAWADRGPCETDGGRRSKRTDGGGDAQDGAETYMEPMGFFQNTDNGKGKSPCDDELQRL